MKLILAIIQRNKLGAVKGALNKVEVFRLTTVDVQGFGRQKGHSEMYRGREETNARRHTSSTPPRLTDLLRQGRVAPGRRRRGW